MRHEYRITKYDPSLRGTDGAYLVDEWTAFSDIGRKFAGRVLTKAEYMRVETLYLDALETFLGEAEIPTLRIRDLELHKLSGATAKGWRENQSLHRSDVRRFATMVLRNKLWARLEAPRRAFVHFGYEYYMYIGTSKKVPNAVAATTASGLFAETIRSPYKRAV
jgi:hypothetical protein